MLVDYFYWQYVIGPRWLIEFIWNFQRALLNFFSVPIMFRTLLAPWHKDTITWRGGSLEDFSLTIIWNGVSRLIGLIFRLIVLTIWLSVEVIFLALALVAVPTYLLWPWFVVTGLATGLSLFLL